jgi:hypothetical protein
MVTSTAVMPMIGIMSGSQTQDVMESTSNGTTKLEDNGL